MVRRQRGALLVFEGVDRCGKTTQTQRLVQSLQKRQIPVELLRFPDRTTSTGAIIDSYLKNGVDVDDKAIHLLFAANRWEANQIMRSKLEAGTTLIVDRYSYSGVCFTAAKPGQNIEWCMAPEVGLPAPDKVFFLELSIEKSMLRGEFGQERYEKKDFQESVLANFRKMMTNKWLTLDASQTIDVLGSQIETAALNIIEESKNEPLGELWRDA